MDLLQALGHALQLSLGHGLLLEGVHPRQAPDGQVQVYDLSPLAGGQVSTQALL